MKRLALIALAILNVCSLCTRNSKNRASEREFTQTQGGEVTQDLKFSLVDDKLYLTNTTDQALDLNHYRSTITGSEPIRAFTPYRARMLAPGERLELSLQPSQKELQKHLVYKTGTEPTAHNVTVTIRSQGRIVTRHSYKAIEFNTKIAYKGDNMLNIKECICSYRMLSDTENGRSRLSLSEKDKQELNKAGSDLILSNYRGLEDPKEDEDAGKLSKSESRIIDFFMKVDEGVKIPEKIWFEFALFAKVEDEKGKGTRGQLLGYNIKEVTIKNNKGESETIQEEKLYPKAPSVPPPNTKN